jgi:hypothetical protein
LAAVDDCLGCGIAPHENGSTAKASGSFTVSE